MLLRLLSTSPARIGRNTCHWCCLGSRQTCPGRTPDTSHSTMRPLQMNTCQHRMRRRVNCGCCLQSQQMSPQRKAGTCQQTQPTQTVSIFLHRTRCMRRLKPRQSMPDTSLPRSLCTHRRQLLLCICLPRTPHTCRSLSYTLLCTGRTPALRRCLHKLDMINRSRCQSPTCRCPPRRESTLPGAPCSLLDTCQSSPLHRRCLPAMSSPMHSSCMLPLHWPRKLTSICQSSNHCTRSSQPSRSTFLQDRPHMQCLKQPHSLSNRCLSSTGGSLPMRRCPLSRGTCLLRNLDNYHWYQKLDRGRIR